MSPRPAAAKSARRQPHQVFASEEAVFSRFSLDPNIDLVLPLEERSADEADTPSGAVLQFGDAGEYAHVVAYAGDYPLGALTGPQLRSFLRDVLTAAEFKAEPPLMAVPLLRMHPRLENKPSGFELRCSGTYAVLSVTTADGAHSFGIAHGKALNRFLEAALERANAGLVDPTGTGKVVSILEGRRLHAGTPAG